MTPGPWALRGRQIRAEGGVGKHVADYMVDAEDGRLIAAAPELLEIVKAVAQGQNCLRSVCDNARALIERIEKKEPWEDV